MYTHPSCSASPRRLLTCTDLSKCSTKTSGWSSGRFRRGLPAIGSPRLQRPSGSRGLSPSLPPPIQTRRLTCDRYWDWALNQSPHEILAQKTVEVTKPAGKAKIPNPLYSYRFSSVDFFKGQGLSPQFETWQQTVRYPTSLNDPHAESSAEFVTAVQASFNSLQQSQAGHWLK